MMYNGFDRGLVSIARATAIAAALCFAVAAPLRAADQPSTNTPAMTPAPATAPTKDNATATPAPVAPAAATSGATGPTKNFTEEDVNAAVKKVIDERTKDGAFVFRDPKLNADLHLVFDEIKIVRGMEGYGWFPNVIFHDKDEPKKKYAIDFWFKPEGQDLKLMDIRVRGGAEAGGRQLGHDHPLAAGLVVATGRRAPRRHGGDPRLAGDERHPRLHRHP